MFFKLSDSFDLPGNYFGERCEVEFSFFLISQCLPYHLKNNLSFPHYNDMDAHYNFLVKNPLFIFISSHTCPQLSPHHCLLEKAMVPKLEDSLQIQSFVSQVFFLEPDLMKAKETESIRGRWKSRIIKLEVSNNIRKIYICTLCRLEI